MKMVKNVGLLMVLGINIAFAGSVHLTGPPTITLPSECVTNVMYPDDPTAEENKIGYLAFDGQGGVMGNMERMEIPKDVTDLHNYINYGDYDKQAYHKFSFLIGTLNLDGTTHAYCLDSSNQKVELTFRIYNALGQQISNDLNFEPSTDYVGKIVLVGKVAQ